MRQRLIDWLFVVKPEVDRTRALTTSILFRPIDNSIDNKSLGTTVIISVGFSKYSARLLYLQLGLGVLYRLMTPSLKTERKILSLKVVGQRTTRRVETKGRTRWLDNLTTLTGKCGLLVFITYLHTYDALARISPSTDSSIFKLCRPFRGWHCRGVK